MSLMSAAPASTAAAIVSARQVSIETRTPASASACDHRAELIDLLLDAHRRGVGATGQHADVDDAGAGGGQVEAALHLLLDALEGVRVGDGVPADVEDAHHDGLARVQIERRLSRSCSCI